MTPPDVFLLFLTANFVFLSVFYDNLELFLRNSTFGITLLLLVLLLVPIIWFCCLKRFFKKDEGARGQPASIRDTRAPPQGTPSLLALRRDPKMTNQVEPTDNMDTSGTPPPTPPPTTPREISDPVRAGCNMNQCDYHCDQASVIPSFHVANVYGYPGTYNVDMKIKGSIKVNWTGADPVSRRSVGGARVGFGSQENGRDRGSQGQQGQIGDPETAMSSDNVTIYTQAG